jgi:cell fate (sporulation/competence/biofilm development) regulator YmcA (YheA/YmcA/DUF963 family)
LELHPELNPELHPLANLIAIVGPTASGKSSFSMNELCLRYKDKVTLYNTDQDCIQLPSYNHFLENHRNETEYVSFLDDDEFINFKEEFNCIDDVMKFMEYPDYLMLNWLFMGCEKRVRNMCSEYLIESNQKSEKEYNDHVKIIVKTMHVEKIVNSHNAVVNMNVNLIFKDGTNTIYPIDDKIPGSLDLKNSPMIWINHYYKMSRNEFLLKCERGKADLLSKRDFIEEFKYDENLIENDSMKRWFEKIKIFHKTPLDLLHYSIKNG